MSNTGIGNCKIYLSDKECEVCEFSKIWKHLKSEDMNYFVWKPPPSLSLNKGGIPHSGSKPQMNFDAQHRLGYVK